MAGYQDPKATVEAFHASYPVIGHFVLDALNKVDPLGCYYGEDVNSDEYLGYAERFISLFERNAAILPAEAAIYLPLVEEAVRRSFYVCQVVALGKLAPRQLTGHVSPLNIQTIACEIREGLAEYHSHIGSWPFAHS